MVPSPGRVPFEVLVEHHGAAMLRLCRALVGFQEAEDVWQETFLAALRAYPELDDGANTEAWLATIAKHKATDHHRRGARLPAPMPELPEAADPGSAVGLPLEAAELWTLVATLPPKQRAAIGYHYLAGLPFARIGELLGNTEAAARRAAADGMKTLRARTNGDLP
ncbi:RNA polymerase sigma factor [Arthrobacter sp. 35W]|uniref:RNA polymerase sigma factor n=1 Tax=Arthrobacter sp. 35W TaxID=1132441 RepID=UPI0004275CD9|nr:RNA polymerase sigma factor [Arthrobacter sp. 35W]